MRGFMASLPSRESSGNLIWDGRPGGGANLKDWLGLVKGSLYKSIGNGFLSSTKLQEVLLDVEVALNDRPLDYVEDDIPLPQVLYYTCNQMHCQCWSRTTFKTTTSESVQSTCTSARMQYGPAGPKNTCVGSRRDTVWGTKVTVTIQQKET